MEIKDSEICFVTCADQQIYIDQFKKKYQSFYDRCSHRFMTYVSTNLPDRIEPTKSLKVFSLQNLQERHPESKEYETIDPDKEYSYYKYPWNIKRHIIHQAFADSYKYVIWTECDAHFSGNIELLKSILKDQPPNSILTSCTKWRYKKEPKNRTFREYEKVCEDLNIKINEDYYATHDGTNAIYFIDKNKHKEFIDYWDTLTIQGYTRNGKPRNGWIENMAFVLGLSEIEILPLRKGIFTIRHERDKIRANKYIGYGR